MTTTSPFAHGESRRKAFRPTNHRIIMLGIEFRYIVTGILYELLSAATRRLGLQSLENTTPIAMTTRIFVNRHKSYLRLVRGVKMQTSAGQWLPRRIKKEEMKPRIIQGITLATARLTPRLATGDQSKHPIRRGTCDFARLAAHPLAL